MTRIDELRQRLAGRWDKRNVKKLPWEEQADTDTTEMHKRWAEGKYSHIFNKREIPPHKDTGNVFEDQVEARGPRKIPPSRLTNLKGESDFSKDQRFQESMSSPNFRPGVQTDKYPEGMVSGFSREYIEKEKLAKLKQRLARIYES